MNTTIRIQKKTGEWLTLACTVTNKNPPTLKVPEWGEWLICPEGMIANVGGNDWRIYDLHPEDCKRICEAEKPAST